MTRKRFIKLTRAYFTRLNEWGKVNGHQAFDMTNISGMLDNLSRNVNRDDYWNLLTKGDRNIFNVGVKENKR